MARMTLTAMALTNSPVAPGIRAIGAKAKAVVSVEPNNGQNGQMPSGLSYSIGRICPLLEPMTHFIDRHDAFVDEQSQGNDQACHGHLLDRDSEHT